MRYATVTNPHHAPTDASTVRELLVLWQHPQSAEIVPIGRFGHSGSVYTFSYTRAASLVTNLRLLPGMSDLTRRYEHTRIPAVFDQRVMDSDRSDFADYMKSIGLDREATPWEQIVESGGTRAGDTLQFMQVPSVADGRARARFLASGVRHIPEAPIFVVGHHVTVSPETHEANLASLTSGDPVLLEAEEHNPQDPCATVITKDHTPIGWVPRALSASVRRLLDAGEVTAKVWRIGGPEVPSHTRLVIDLDVPAPDAFQFDTEGLWEPIGQ